MSILGALLSSVIKSGRVFFRFHVKRCLHISLVFTQTHTHTNIVPVGSHFDFPEVETEQHFLERPLLAVMGNERVQPYIFKGKTYSVLYSSNAMH